MKVFLTLFLSLLFTTLKGQETFCTWFCGDVSDCFSCDLEADLPGSYSKSLFLLPELTNIDPVCDGSISHNVIWYAFVAGSQDLSITVGTSNCSNDGIEIGLVAECGDSECIAGDRGCPVGNTLFLTTSALQVGEVYYIWLDGCAGDQCDFDIDVDHAPFELDEPLSISAYSECRSKCLTEDCSSITACDEIEQITVCPGETVIFYPRHDGDADSDYGIYDDECSFYSPNFNANLIYDFYGVSYEVNVLDNGGPELRLIIPDGINGHPDYETELCLLSVSVSNDLCSKETSEIACITVIVNTQEEERYDYQVCREDMEGGWTVPTFDDPNGDGLSWLGDPVVNFNTNDWDLNCYTQVSLDPNCECPIEQTLCIEVLSDLRRHDLYMYDCQFDNDDEYEWIWENNETYLLSKYEVSSIISFPENSLLVDWDDEFCDTTMYITVHSYDVGGQLEQIACDPTLSQATYAFELDLAFQEEPFYNNWPNISRIGDVVWLDSDRSVIATSAAGTFIKQGDQPIEVYIRVNYSFHNGVWGEGLFAQSTSCEKTFGPYVLTSRCDGDKTATCPTWAEGMTLEVNGITQDCENNTCTITESDFIRLTVSENLLPDGGTIEWWVDSDPDFLPKQDGTRLGSSQISSNWRQGQQYAELLAINYRDPLNSSEFFVVGTGSGLEIDNFLIDLDENCDPTCSPDCMDEVYGSQCPWQKIDQQIFSDCPNVIAVGQGDFVPPNSILVVLLDKDNTLQRSADALCSLDGCIYVLYNECERCLDAFEDEGNASYTIFGNGYSSTLTYTANPDGGSVNSNGDYIFERDSLPAVNQIVIDITATVTEQIIDLPCAEFSGRQYVKGIIVSDNFNSDCCSPYTPTLNFDLDCPSTGSTLIWLDTSQLPRDITINNGMCSAAYVFPNSAFSDGTNSYAYPLPSTAYASSCTGPVNFTSTHTPQSGFNEGSTRVTYTLNDGCGNQLTDGFTITITCDAQPPNPPSTGVFQDFPFLNNLVDQADCAGTTISVYESGIYNYIHVQTMDGGKLYFQDGTLYCTDAQNFDCVQAYGLGAAVEVWECDDVVTPPGPNPSIAPEFFDDFPFLNNLIDLSDCGGTTVSLFEQGIYTYIYVETVDGGTLYFQDGTKYCTDAPGFSCVAAYGFGAASMVWVCDGPGGGGQMTTPELFVNYPWLEGIVDLSDCEDAVVSVYSSGNSLFFFVNQDGVTTMYAETGQFYCQDGPGFSCLSAYGFTAGDLEETWECEGLQDGELIEQREWLDEELFSVQVFPNPSSDLFYIKSESVIDDVQLFSASRERVDLELIERSEKLWIVSGRNLYSGVYFLKSNSGSNEVIERIIKL